MTQREEIMGLEIEKYIDVLIAENFNEDSEKVSKTLDLSSGAGSTRTGTK